jgi:hypothetical protein
MTAGRQLAISERFPASEDGKIKDSLRHSAAIIADSVITENGAPLWTADELVDQTDAKLFGEISEVVCAFLNPVRDPN